jgi:hypothetical protein
MAERTRVEFTYISQSRLVLKGHGFSRAASIAKSLGL